MSTKSTTQAAKDKNGIDNTLPAHRELSIRKTYALLLSLYPNYVIRKHHRKVCAAIDDWVWSYLFGHAPRLQVSLPPQTGKSTMIRCAILRLLGLEPTTRVAWVTYEAGLAEQSSRIIRDLMHSQSYRDTFGELVTADTKRAATEWDTLAGGGLITGTSITGRPVDVLVCDDLVRDYEMYLSAAYMRQIRNWIETVAATRLHNQSAVLSIGTRWGDNDAIAHLRQVIPGDWKAVEMPALDERGRSIWEERHSAARLQRTRETIGPIKWASIYQQQPIAVSGAVLTRTAWRIEDAAPSGLRWIRYWDLGFTQGGHETAGALVGTNNDEYWIQDIISTNTGWSDSEKLIIETAQKDGRSITLSGEATGIQSGYWEEIRRKVSRYGVRCIPRKSKPDKEADVRAWASEQNAGMIRLVRGNWNKRFMDLADSIGVVWDVDWIDAVSGAIAMLRDRRSRRGCGRSWLI